MSSKDKLAALQAAYKADEEAEEKRKGGGKSTDWYRFFDMDFGQTATVRFLPDANTDSPYYVMEKWVHKLDVEVDGKTQTRYVPCLKHEHYGAEPCPICAHSQKYYDKSSDLYDTDIGGYYWRKRSFIANILVIKSPIDYIGDDGNADDDTINRSPHRLINLETKIYDKMKMAVAQEDLDDYPTDYEDGYNFRLNCTKNGKYKSFDTSSFAPKASPVPAEMLEGLEPYDLRDKLPKKPSLEYVEAVLHASITGEPFTWKAEDNGSKAVDLASAAVDSPAVDSAATTSAIVADEPAKPAGTKPKIDIKAVLARRQAEANS